MTGSDRVRENCADAVFAAPGRGLTRLAAAVGTVVDGRRCVEERF